MLNGEADRRESCSLLELSHYCSLKMSKNKDILTNIKNHSTNANIIKITKKYTNMRKYNECLVNI